MKLLHQQRQRDARLVSYQRRVQREKFDGYGWTMSLDTVKTPEEILLTKQRMARLERHIDRLQPRIGRVMRLRLGINCKVHTFEEIAEQFDVTRERIRQMEGKGLRIIKRRIWIEERPEEYRRQCENERKARRERIEAEKAAEVEVLRKKAELADWSPPTATPVGVFRPRDDSGKFQSVRRERTVLDDIVDEQKRALALERQYSRWAAEREAWLRSPMPSWVVDDPIAAKPYPYKLRKVAIKRDWLHVASEGFTP